jgi:hypothetical protein
MHVQSNVMFVLYSSFKIDQRFQCLYVTKYLALSCEFQNKIYVEILHCTLMNDVIIFKCIYIYT